MTVNIGISVEGSVEKITATNLSHNVKTGTPPYTGRLLVYITEPTSRWNNYDGNQYHFGFLDFAVDEKISVEYLETYNTSFTWDGRQAGYRNIDPDNLMVIGVVFNSEGNKGYARPPAGNPFEAYYVDASAGAVPGETGFNGVSEDFTHTVFVEEATATWCPFCPAMAEALNSIYKSAEYPFYFVALIYDKNPVAAERLQQDYNIYGFPTAFFDGGKRVLVGGYSDPAYYINKIKSCGQRDAHELNLSLSVEHVEGDLFQIDIGIINLEQIINNPPNNPIIKGQTSGKAGEEYTYTFSALDPEGNDVYYWIEWFEGCPGVNWQGPYKSGEEVTFTNRWPKRGTYTIRGKAKDIYNAESDWSTLEVSMLKNMEIKNELNDKKPLRVNIVKKNVDRVLINNDNTPPNPPEIHGPTSGVIRESYTYNVTVTDPDEEDGLLRLEMDFGDGTITEDCGCDKAWENGETLEIPHIWRRSGTYEITARVMDVHGEWSNWSDPLTVSMPKTKILINLLHSYLIKQMFHLFYLLADIICISK
jgi:thiol-disulfide isomerase/thioredoxin